jgi:hypothetical protein
MVDGVKVTGVNVLQNNEVSIMLSHIVTKPGNTTLPESVTVAALTVPMNPRDLMYKHQQPLRDPIKLQLVAVIP